MEYKVKTLGAYRTIKYEPGLRKSYFACVPGAATPDFNSLVPAPSVPSLISIESVELLCRASNISITNPFCFVKQKQETLEAFSQFLFTNIRRTKIHADKGCNTALITIKQGNQHAVPNRNPKHNQAVTKTHYSFRHVHLLTIISKILYRYC